MIKRHGFICTVKKVQFAVNQYGSPLTVVADIISIMRNDDHRPVLTLLKQLCMTFFMKAAIAYRNDFINQKAIKINRHGKCKRKARPHTG